MGPYIKHVFVCTGGKWCPFVDGDGLGVYSALKKKIVERGLSKKIRINQAGCFSQCGNGPMVVVYPDNIWYAHVTVEDVEDIINKHLIEDHPLERIRYYHTGGPNVLPRDSNEKSILSTQQELTNNTKNSAYGEDITKGG